MSSDSLLSPPSHVVRNALIALIISKLIWFCLFTWQIDGEFDETRTIGIAYTAKDTPMYFDPMESLSQDGYYHSICRMPGLLPIYYPVRLIFDSFYTKQIIILLQVITDILASLLLCLMAYRFSSSVRVTYITAALLSLGSFISIRSMYLLSDSFGISTLIISAFFLMRFAERKRNMDLFLTGLFLVWAIFLRQIIILLVPVYIVILFSMVQYRLRSLLIPLVWFSLPIITALSAWTIRNRLVYERTVVLVAPVEECMTQLTPAYSAIRKFIIVTGKDFQPWTVGDAAHWFVTPPSRTTTTLPYNAADFTSAYNADSLQALKNDYHNLLLLQEGSPEYERIEEVILKKTQLYSDAYKAEHHWRFLILDKLGFLTKFLFPKKIDDLPLPSFAMMNPIQKIMKGWSLVMLWLVNALSLAGLAYCVIKWQFQRILWLMIPFSLVVVQGILGFIEQRFLAISYPFMVVICALLINGLWTGYAKRINAQPY